MRSIDLGESCEYRISSIASISINIILSIDFLISDFIDWPCRKYTVSFDVETRLVARFKSILLICTLKPSFHKIAHDRPIAEKCFHITDCRRSLAVFSAIVSDPVYMETMLK